VNVAVIVDDIYWTQQSDQHQAVPLTCANQGSGGESATHRAGFDPCGAVYSLTDSTLAVSDGESVTHGG
jgi:hypothetical protein